MSWLDDFHQFTQEHSVISDEDAARVGSKGFYCPHCAKHLTLKTGSIKHSNQPCYRFSCTTQYHYRTQWHKTIQGAFMEILQDFQKG